MSPARLLLVLVALAPAAAAQLQAERLDAVDHAERQRRIALTGDLGLPPLLPLLPDSPLDSMYFADRMPVPPGESPPPGDGGPGQMFDGFLPAGPDGTGTDKPEVFKYQVPGGYDPLGEPVPMVIAYHGFGSSAASVATSTTLDEEANARGWFYMAPTGIDDQLFGSPVSQQNTEAAVQWMLDNFQVDPDRLYMVGFSMGGGVSANFSARRRDPDGIMIAALGVVSGSFDWTMAWNLGTATAKQLLENPYNFGGTPFQFPFAYQRSSGLYFSNGSYPPLPGVLEFGRSMALNLGSVPTYVTWDLGDTLPEVAAQEPVFVGLMAGLGGQLVSKPVAGTPPPTHSWSVLDEADLFDFFEGKVAQRLPPVFEALVDSNRVVSWVDVRQQAEGDFTRVDALALKSGNGASVSGVTNARRLVLDLEDAGLAGSGPFHVLGASADAAGFELGGRTTAVPPAWMIESAGGALADDFESDPGVGAVLAQVGGFGTRTLDVVTQPDYLGATWSFPEPALIGQAVTLELDGPTGADTAWLLLGWERALGTAKGHTFAVQLGAPALVFVLALGADGDVTLPGALPANPLLSGAELLFQAAFTSGPQVVALGNMWAMDVQ